MNPYERFVLPWLLDLACGTRAFARQRRAVVPRARGRVLEIGMGSGLNLPHYQAGQLHCLHGLDPAEQLGGRARRRAAEAGIDIELRHVSAERIDAGDAVYDCVVCTYTLCSIAEPLRALAEVRRVLAPGGLLLYCEHGLAPEPEVQRWQRRLTPLWRPLAGGCHLDRDVPALLRAAGFEAADMQQGYIPGPRVFTYNYWGAATVAP